jgi:hypothetical protein
MRPTRRLANIAGAATSPGAAKSEGPDDCCRRVRAVLGTDEVIVGDLMLCAILQSLGTAAHIVKADRKAGGSNFDWPLFGAGRFEELSDFHHLATQALIGDAEIEFEQLARLSLGHQRAPILSFRE